MKTPGFLLAKFGRKEHLEALKNGIIFFNAIKNYRNDGTSYRGDSMEGKIPIDPEQVKMFDEDGNDFWPLLKNVGSYVSLTWSWQGDDDLLMFCASALTKEIMKNIEDNKWILGNDFKNAVKEFGDYVIILTSAELCSKIMESKEGFNNRIHIDARTIIYRELSDFSDTDAYRKTGSQLDPYFVKDYSKYRYQNEWRIILWGDPGLQLNEFGGYFIKTEPLEYAYIFETEKFLNGFSVEGI